MVKAESANTFKNILDRKWDRTGYGYKLNTVIPNSSHKNPKSKSKDFKLKLDKLNLFHALVKYIMYDLCNKLRSSQLTNCAHIFINHS